MIYHIENGAQSDIKKNLMAMALTLFLTIGFPLFATLASQSDLTPRPTSISQNDSPGVVLGENTGDDTQNLQADEDGVVSGSVQPSRGSIESTTPMPKPAVSPKSSLPVTHSPSRPPVSEPSSSNSENTTGSGSQSGSTSVPQPIQSPSAPSNPEPEPALAVGVDTPVVSLQLEATLSDGLEADLLVK